MHLDKLVATMAVVVAFCAIPAGNASAAATTTAAEWYTGSSPGTTLVGSKSLNVAVKSGTTIVLDSQIGSTPLKLTATGVQCQSCTVENKVITSGAGKSAFGTGKLLFTGVTVNAPANCKVVSEAGVSGQIVTKSLNFHADFMNGTTAVMHIFPTTGTSFMVFELQNNGATCGDAGLYSITGTLFADLVNATGVQATTQQVNVSPTIESTDGGGLALGSKFADLTGSAVFSLAGGEAFGVH